MLIRIAFVSILSVAAISGSATGTVRAWQQRIDVAVPLPVPKVELQSANPFASDIDAIPKLRSSTPPEKVNVAGQAIAAAFVNAQGECQGVVPLEVPFPGLTGTLVSDLSETRFDAAQTGEQQRASWVVLEVRIEGKVKEAAVISQDLALPDPDNPPEPIRAAVPPPAGHLLQLPAAQPEELTSLARPKRVKVHASATEPEVSVQALVHVTEDGRCDRYVPITMNSGLDRWFSGFLATWRLDPPTQDGNPTDAWVVYTARLRMKLSSLDSSSARVLTDRRFDPSS